MHACSALYILHKVFCFIMARFYSLSTLSTVGMFYVIVDGKEGWIPSDILRISSRRSSVSSSYSRPSRSRSVSPSPMHSRSPSPMDMSEMDRKFIATPNARFLLIKKPLRCHNALSSTVRMYLLIPLQSQTDQERFQHPLLRLNFPKSQSQGRSLPLLCPTTYCRHLISPQHTEHRVSQLKKKLMKHVSLSKKYILSIKILRRERICYPLSQFCVHFSH